MKSLMFLIAAGLVAIPGHAAAEDADKDATRQEMEEARRDLAEAARRVAELSRELGEGFAWHVRSDAPRRAMLGIRIGESDEQGVEVLSVTPEGPADKAGIRAGDRIVAINGTDLTNSDRPSHALLKAMGEIEPGASVSIDYRRGDATRGTTVVAGESERAFRFLLPGDKPKFRPPRAPLPPFSHFTRGWGDMELVSLSPELGEYFGTDKGLLVVRAPQDGKLQLRDGDVITAIGGREPQDVGQAIRMLRSYEPGESVRIDVLRKRRKLSLDFEIPERRTGFFEFPAFEAFSHLSADKE